MESYGIKAPARVYWNLTSPRALRRDCAAQRGVLSNCGSLIVDTGVSTTGRAAKDKAIVREPGSEDKAVLERTSTRDFPGWRKFVLFETGWWRMQPGETAVCARIHMLADTQNTVYRFESLMSSPGTLFLPGPCLSATRRSAEPHQPGVHNHQLPKFSG